jgi:hypothetical protein
VDATGELRAVAEVGRGGEDSLVWLRCADAACRVLGRTSVRGRVQDVAVSAAGLVWVATEAALWRADGAARTIGAAPALVCARLDAGDGDGPGPCMRAVATDGVDRIAVATASEMAYSDTNGEALHPWCGRRSHLTTPRARVAIRHADRTGVGCV